MSSNRKVTSALFHSPLFVQGVGQLAAQLAPTTKGAGKIKELSMEWDGETLVVTVNGIEVGVPGSNIQCMTFGKPAGTATVVSKP